MFSKFRPINENILVKLIEKETKTSGGLFIPDDAQEKNQKAIVICPGNSKQLMVDDNVFYKKYMGTALDEQYLILKEEDILGVL